MLTDDALSCKSSSQHIDTCCKSEQTSKLCAAPSDVNSNEQPTVGLDLINKLRIAFCRHQHHFERDYDRTFDEEVDDDDDEEQFFKLPSRVCHRYYDCKQIPHS